MKCAEWGSARNGEVPAMGKCPQWGSARNGEVPAMGKCPQWARPQANPFAFHHLASLGQIEQIKRNAHF